MGDGEALHSGRFLIVVWNSGGGTQPMIGLGRLLSRRGHAVRFLAPRTHRERVEATGCAWSPFPPEAEFDPSRGRALEDQEGYVIMTVTGQPLAEALLTEVERDPPDVVVIDHQLRNVMSAAELTGLPIAVLVHTAYRFHGVADDPERWGWDFHPVNETRRRLGLSPVPRGHERLSLALQRRHDRVLVVMPSEFDPRPPEAMLPNLVHVGPIFEEDPGTTVSHLPWLPDHPDPLVVVSMSSQYMHHESALNRVIEAVERLPVRVLLTTGYELEPSELPGSSSVVVRSYVPHLAVLPHASLVVTHGGMGTIMAAFACGIPCLVMPLGRDQHVNARTTDELGAGNTVQSDASIDEVRSAVVDGLHSEELRAGARRMAEVIEKYGSGAMAVFELEQLLDPT